MAKADLWLPLYVADYRADTMRFSTEQHGAYLLIIMDYWRVGPPPDDDQVLAQIAGLSVTKWKKHRPLIASKFRIVDGVWKHKRIDEEIAKAKVVQDSLSRKGKAGALARWGPEHASGNATGIAQAMPGDAPSQSQPPEPNPLPTSPEVGVPDGTSVPDCPHQRIIELYHQTMPLNPRVLEWTEARQGHLRARWREKSLPNGRTQGYASVEAGLAFWKRFFGYCADSKFLTGRAESKQGKPPFCPSLDWLVKPENFAKVLEGNYHR